LKLLALIKQDADIIFMSDVRLNSNTQKSALNDIIKRFSFNGYNFYHNSPMSSRGVAIAIKTNADPGVSLVKQDRIGNILILKLSNNLVLAAVYGPNDNNLEFFADLTNYLNELGSPNIIAGGDWNATWDLSPPAHNIDTFMMVNIPSRERSERLRSIADRFSLTDPYRDIYPIKREYTYIPNAAANINRSRIDFFLISRELSPQILDAEIETGKLSTLFDHKAIVIKTGKQKVKIDPNKVCNSIINDPAVEIITELAVKEFYLNNADPNAVPRYTINTIRYEIGRILSKLKRATDIEYAALANNTISDPVRAEIANLTQEAGDIAETLPDQEYFESLPVIINPDTFFEGLVLSVKNEILSKQAAIYKTKNLRKKMLSKKITDLKKNFNANHAEIYRTERILDDLNNEELKKELDRYEKFERLNNEKITPYFMKLVRNDLKQDITLAEICDDAGNKFQTDPDRDSYINQFYGTLYKKAENVAIPDDCIENFLGADIHHPAVMGSILSENEKLTLDEDLTIQEFDTAVKQIKLGSSPGIDGLSNKFIKKYWSLFRVPLYRYTVFCLNTGNLTQSFRTAKVRLIPKKGDPKKIGNWRPISLLNCFYKLISRVLTNRIRIVSDKVTSVGQKGYSTVKNGQEVLLSLFDASFKLKKMRKTGCVVSLDIKKAFDSLSHDFVKRALKFFNFGDRIISWILTISTNRTASIILNNGNLGTPFNLERGNAQGDVISPFLFNICYQVLLLKLECDLQIKSIDLPEADIRDPVQFRSNLSGATLSVSHRAKKVFAFADDCNILCILEKNSIEQICKVLRDFESISGLACNVQKSNILIVGAPVADPNRINEISNLGLNIVPEITVLGFKLSNSDTVFDDNFAIILNKLNNQYRIWSRFNLSLPGRINVAKTMFYSQISYIGTVIPFTERQYIEMEDVIHRFAGGNLRIAKKRTFLPVENGGLGLFGLENFIMAQKTSWIRR
jgi:exonuclease III